MTVREVRTLTEREDCAAGQVCNQIMVDEKGQRRAPMGPNCAQALVYQGYNLRDVADSRGMIIQSN